MPRRWVALFLTLVAGAACDRIDSTQPEPPPGPSMAAGFGTVGDLERTLGDPFNLDGADVAAAAPFVAQAEAIANAPPVDSNAIDGVFRAWFRNLVLGRLTSSTADDELYFTLADYWYWVFQATVLLNSTVSDVEARFAKEIAQFRHLAAPKLRLAINSNIATCRDELSVEALANALFWYAQAGLLDIRTVPAFQLDDLKLRTEITNKCAQVGLKSVNLPAILDVGTVYTMQVTLELGLGLAPTPVPAAFHVVASSGEATVEQPGLTDGNGYIELDVRPDVVGQVAIDLTACLVLPGRTAPTPFVCGGGTITRQAQDPPLPPPGPPPGPPSPPPNCSGTLTSSVVQVHNVATLNAVAGFLVIDGNLSIASNDSLVNVTLPCLRTVTGTLGISNNRAMTQIAFPQLVEVGRTLTLVSNPILAAAGFPVLQQIGQVGTIAGTLPGAFGINNNPLLTTLDVGAVTIHRNAPSQLGGLQLLQPLGLTTLNGLSAAIAVDTLFFTVPAAGQPGLTRAQFQAYKASAPSVQQVCELPSGAGGTRVCQ